MHYLSVDLETFSDVNIMRSGMYKYVQAPAFEILLMAYAYDGEPVKQIDFTAGETISPELYRDLFDPAIIKKAWNTPFEWYCLSKHLSVHDPLQWLPQWRDTMIEALYTGYPAKLSAAGDAVGLADDRKKLAIGKALIKYFCIPCAPTASNGNRLRNHPRHEPEKWELFKTYNKQDVEAERTLDGMISSFPVPASEWALWRLDQEINLRGVYVDKQLIAGAQQASAITNELLLAEAATISKLANPKSVAQLKAWINEETDEEIESLNKATVADLIKTTDDDVVRRMLQIRQEISKTSIKKYDAMEAAVCDDGKVRGLAQFYGANRTGRWAGRLIQVQNLPRNYIDTLDFARRLIRANNLNMARFMYANIPDTLSQLIRTALIPSRGNVFTIADFSAIEARVIAWIAGESWRQQIFATHGKIYEASASAMFGVPLEKIKRGNPEYALRAKGKVAELALGYQGASGALIQMGALNQGLTEEELPDIVRRWRAASPRIVDLWYACDRAAVDTIRTGRINVVKCVTFAREVDTANGQDFLTIQLPSGRKLYYNHPQILPGGRGDRVQYHGVHQLSKKWGPLEIYGGKFVENITQAIARDCLAISLERLAAAGFKIVFHVHDEAILDTPAEQIDALEVSTAIMGQPITWAPGLLLRADGFTTPFYKKD